MSFFSKNSKKKEKATSNSGNANKNDGQHMVHSTSLTMFSQERTVTSQRIETQTIIQSSGINSPFVSRSLNSLTDRNGATNYSLNKSLVPSSAGNELSPSIFATKPPYQSSISTDATSFTRAGAYRSTPPRTAFSGNPISTSSNNRNYRTTADATPIFPSRNNNIPVYKAASEDLRQKLTIKVQKSTKFYDDPKVTKVPTYKTRSKSRGKLLLINNMKFVNEKQMRKGAELDEVNVVELFKQMGFQVEKYRDLNKGEMVKKITNFRGNSSLKKVDIGTVIIMSHGTGKERSDSTEVVCTDGNLLETTWIINQFNSTSCPYLRGKPKIFIFQCCRGDNIQTVVTQTDATPIPRQVSDVLVAYSTVPGFVSHRDPQQGTWYIQAICKVFMEHAQDTDVENLLKIVDSILSKYVSDKQSSQTSSYENMGFKTCYFHPQLSQ